ncbi:MAG: 3',5'-cyclic-AMP phosphodiesterase [Gammaproteobacteria bacterium]
MSAADSFLRVVQISDTHIHFQPNARRWGVDVDAGLTAVIGRLKRRHWPVDLLLITGDLVQDEGAPAYERLCALLEPLPVPIYCLPGNHDLPGEMRATLNGGRIQAVRHIIRGRWQFVLLDSALPSSPAGHLAAEELRFLDATLAAHSDLHAIVCLHHHPVAVDSAWIDAMAVDNADDLFAVIDRHPQVRAVIWGHIHQAFSARRNGVQLLSVPSTCAQFKPAVERPEIDAQAQPGYRWFELHDDGKLSTGIERIGAVLVNRQC